MENITCVDKLWRWQWQWRWKQNQTFFGIFDLEINLTRGSLFWLNIFPILFLQEFWKSIRHFICSFKYLFSSILVSFCIILFRINLWQILFFLRATTNGWDDVSICFGFTASCAGQLLNSLCSFSKYVELVWQLTSLWESESTSNEFPGNSNNGSEHSWPVVTAVETTTDSSGYFSWFPLLEASEKGKYTINTTSCNTITRKSSVQKCSIELFVFTWRSKGLTPWKIKIKCYSEVNL